MIAKNKAGIRVGFLSFLFMPKILEEKLSVYDENIYVVK